MIKRISYIAVAIMTIVAGACQQDLDIVEPAIDSSIPEGWVEIEFAANTPLMTEVEVRAADPDGIDVQNLMLFCFNDYGLYITHVDATLKAAVEKPSLSGTYKAVIPEDTRIIHFVGNQNPNLIDANMFINRTEDEIQDDMVGASGMIIYWSRFIFANEGSFQQQLALCQQIFTPSAPQHHITPRDVSQPRVQPLSGLVTIMLHSLTTARSSRT